MLKNNSVEKSKLLSNLNIIGIIYIMERRKLKHDYYLFD